MTVQDYLLKFRKINSLESLEKLFDHLNTRCRIIRTSSICTALLTIVAPNWSLAVVCSMWGKCLNPYGVTLYKKVAFGVKCYILSALQISV